MFEVNFLIFLDNASSLEPDLTTCFELHTDHTQSRSGSTGWDNLMLKLYSFKRLLPHLLRAKFKLRQTAMHPTLLNRFRREFEWTSWKGEHNRPCSYGESKSQKTREETFPVQLKEGYSTGKVHFISCPVKVKRGLVGFKESELMVCWVWHKWMCHVLSTWLRSREERRHCC